MTQYESLGSAYYVTKYLSHKKTGAPYAFIPKDWVEFNHKDLVEVSVCKLGSDLWYTDTKQVTKVARALAININPNFGFHPGDMITLRLRRYIPAAGSGDKEEDKSGTQ